MNVNQIARRKCAIILLILLSISGRLWAKSAAGANLARIRIDNFGQINDNYYRGAQPDGQDYSDLAAIGIKTVIDLTQDGRDDEQELVERAGMKFYRIPLTTYEQPADAAVAEFLKLVNDPANQPVYVHCQGGRHRTGVMTAVYRMTHDGWNADRAYTEMKQYHFDGFPGHPTLKHFVYEYYATLDHPRIEEDRHRVAEGDAEK
jgi:protein tyrosine/serine phosphatase